MRAAAPAAPGLSRHSGLFSLSRVGVWKGSVSPFSETKKCAFQKSGQLGGPLSEVLQPSLKPFQRAAWLYNSCH